MFYQRNNDKTSRVQRNSCGLIQDRLTA
jgi:hypothetical protein